MRRLDWASAQLQTGPTRSRRRGSALLFELLEPQALVGFAAVIEATDSPPAWFGGVPETDLQPALLAAAENALRVEFTRALSADTAAVAAARMLGGVSRDLHALAATDPYKGSRGEGVLAVMTNRGSAIAWVGTARAYVVGSHGVTCLTRDHDLLHHWIESRRAEGKPPTQTEIDEFPHRGILTTVLGASADTRIDTVEISLRVDDRLILVSPSAAPSVERLGHAMVGASTAHDLALTVATHAARQSPGHAIGVAVVGLVDDAAR